MRARPELSHAKRAFKRAYLSSAFALDLERLRAEGVAFDPGLYIWEDLAFSAALSTPVKCYLLAMHKVSLAAGGCRDFVALHDPARAAYVAYRWCARLSPQAIADEAGATAAQRRSTFPCDRCGLTFARYRGLHEHMLQAHRAQCPRHTCEKCGKSFARANALVKHLRLGRCFSTRGRWHGAELAIG